MYFYLLDPPTPLIWGGGGSSWEDKIELKLVLPSKKVWLHNQTKNYTSKKKWLTVFAQKMPGYFHKIFIRFFWWIQQACPNLKKKKFIC